MTPILVADLTPPPNGRPAHTDEREYINPLRIIAIHPGAGKQIDSRDGVIPVFGVDYEAPGQHVDAFNNRECFGPTGLYRGRPAPLTLPLWAPKAAGS